MQTSSPRGSFPEVLFAFLRLGLTSFGGPVAHLGYFRQEFVERRKWLDEHTYSDMVALCQFLPGPASSQVGISLGIRRAGLLGGLAAWLGFTLPSAATLILFAYGVSAIGDVADSGWLRGLKIAAVAVVALAVWGMARNLSPDRPRATISIAAAIAMLAWPTALGQVIAIVVAGAIGWRLLREERVDAGPAQRFPVGRGVAVASLVLFFTLLLALPILSRAVADERLEVFDSFYRAGSLVFGGGHVVLPLLQTQVVPTGWVGNEEFIAGYGAAQAVPGPLFTFSAYLGAVAYQDRTAWLGGLFALSAIFLPSFLLVVGVMPFWDRLRTLSGFRGASRGIGAAVVGLLVAALYNPVWTSAVHTREDFGLALAAFGLLAFWRAPPWLVVALSAGGGQAIAMLT